MEAPPAAADELAPPVVEVEEEEDWLTFWSEEPSPQWKSRKNTVFINLFTVYVGFFYD